MRVICRDASLIMSLSFIFGTVTFIIDINDQGNIEIKQTLWRMVNGFHSCDHISLIKMWYVYFILIDFLKREFAAVSSFCLSIVQVWAEETLVMTTVGKNLHPVKFATISACTFLSDKV